MSNRKLTQKRDPIGVQWYSANSIYAYHRSRSVIEIYHIAHDQFIPGKRGTGAIYGPALYATYDLRSQQKPYMLKNYGDFILRSVVDLSNFLVFDKDFQDKLNKPTAEVQMRLAGLSSSAPVVTQLRYSPNPLRANSIILWHEDQIRLRQPAKEIVLKSISKSAPLRSKVKTEKYHTSEYAKAMWDIFREDLPKKFAGMLFTGANDGHILVCYDLTAVEFLDYAKYTNTAIKTNKQPFWEQWPARLTDTHFIEQLLVDLHNIGIPRGQKLIFINRVRKMRVTQRLFLLSWLIDYKPDNTKHKISHFLKWFLGSEADSDKMFAELFMQHLEVPKFSQVLTELKTKVSWQRRKSPISSTFRKFMGYRTAVPASFGYILLCKIRRVRGKMFHDEWMCGLRMEMAAGNKIRGKGYSFVHNFSLLIEMWRDISEIDFANYLSYDDSHKFLTEIVQTSKFKDRFKYLSGFNLVEDKRG